MVTIIADNILSPLGKTTIENVQAVRDSRTRLRQHRLCGIPEPFVASMFEDGEGVRPKYEELVGDSILACLDSCQLEGRVLLVLASTKGQTTGHNGVTFGESAQRIVRRISVFLPKVEVLHAITVSNACISGLSAQIVAQRMLEMGCYDYAIVSGCDVLSPFIVAGFLSLKAMSPETCRPFDIDRNGLNLGEAAATLVFKRCSVDEVRSGQWVALPGAMRNDAFSTVGPSRTAEGCKLALQSVRFAVPHPACLSAHGTATLYNDNMESIGIHDSVWSDVPVSGLKGYFGHTMGAAGIVESIVTMHAMSEGWIPGTRGYGMLGTSRPIRVIDRHLPLLQSDDSISFVKMMSGFGGCNAVMPYVLGPVASDRKEILPSLVAGHTVRITPDSATVDGKKMDCGNVTGRQLLSALYRQLKIDYPRYYKMDLLCRLGFIAAELLLHVEGLGATEPDEDPLRAVILFGKTASIVSDRNFEATLQRPDGDFYPSPADFVYTLPNIVTGEIAIRHRYHGETCYFALSERDEAMMQQLSAQAFLDPQTQSAICGWINADDEEHFEAELTLLFKR